MGSKTMPQPQTGGPFSTAMPAFKGMLQTPMDLEFKDSTPHPRSFPMWKCLAMTLCRCAWPDECQDSPLAHDLADVAGPLQQLRQEELGVWDAAHDLLGRVG